MSFSLRNIVFLRLLIPFLFGIILGLYTKFEITKSTLFIGLILVSFWLLINSLIQFKIKYRWLTGAVTFLSFLFIGFMLMKQAEVRPPNKFNSTKELFAVEIVSAPIEKENSIRYDAMITFHPNNQLLEQKIIVYQEKRSKTKLEPGNEIFLEQYINRISPPSNPHEFNYQKFMDRKGFFYQVYLQDEHILDIINGKKKKQSLISTLRNQCFNFIELHVAEAYQGTAKALLLGYKDDLDSFTAETFSRSGTMHILAVSGLHVGIIYLILFTLLSAIRKKVKYTKWVNILLLITGIWLFAFLTGGKASVMRAATMFSLFAIGRFLFPYTNSINILAAVALLMLSANPYYILDVGFQLSFSAVAGILLILPLLKPFYTGSKFLNYFLGICFVSIAAQIATLPFVIFYFNQFPLLGLFANLIAVPLAFAIVSIGFVGILLSPVPVLGWIFGKILTFSLFLLSTSNQMFSNFDFAVLERLYLTPVQTLLFALFLLLGVGFLRSKKNHFLFSAMTCFLLFLSSISILKITASKTASLFIYQVNGHQIIDIHQGRTSFLLTDMEVPESSFEYSIAPNHLANYIHERKLISIDSTVLNEAFYLKDSLLIFKNHSFQFIGQKPSKVFAEAEFLLLNHPSNQVLKEELLQNKKLIIANRYRPDYLKLPEHFYFLQEKGAFQIR